MYKPYNTYYMSAHAKILGTSDVIMIEKVIRNGLKRKRTIVIYIYFKCKGGGMPRTGA